NSNTSDEPGAPSPPEIVDWDKDFVDLKWSPPLKDGGAPVTGYIVEKREKGSPRWTKCAEVKGPDCKARAEDLDEGVEYEFRVIAVNNAGPGEPSLPSRPVTPKPRKLPPKIDRKNLKNITVREGEPIMFLVKVLGEPPPDIVWYRGNKTISSSGSRQIEVTPNNTKFVIQATERKDTGVYKIHASNRYGADDAEVEINVISK
ncbi:immunoglobulin superfamily member 22-like, partial [Halyomorpha halys]|uniref:immunoglobulin superfamily member 22-like n=1 Tax=Halyomorpha halys TaxID=286706 RepID=UPI0034D374EA